MAVIKFRLSKEGGQSLIPNYASYSSFVLCTINERYLLSIQPAKTSHLEGQKPS